ncbi:hypothetical protein DSAG12_03780 [Promethearchaeum syntrophicum]|uniref:Uncharacterized protein n=1 Tax=Promethearchaeum syntrophicum TaxID=2594042 RepID=A0A5B9DFP4_9ARCH|nr:hypothetical protein [Candidatus Prometheoarchaeum syntrophicum]QEE17942.1 hypothetical protein DSAG12_03780 [Candidatus Prometheoarchaeum syntrophicum]
MKEWSIKNLRKIRKNSSSKIIQIIDIINGEIYDFQSIFPDASIAKDQIKKDLDSIIQDTYDYFPGSININKDIILCLFYHKKQKDIIGTIALNLYFKNDIDYIELGLSMIAKKYRKMGFQSIEARRIREYAYFFLHQGNPFYISARMASAATQLQIQRGQLHNQNGEKVNVAHPKGFIPFYIANKNENGQYLLEFGLFYDAWSTLEKIILMDTHLPEIIKNKRFQIFNPQYRADVNPIFHEIEILRDGKVKFDKGIYVWDEIKNKLRIFGNLKSSKNIYTSDQKKFLYSNYSAPDSRNLAIAIESINNLDFLNDVNPNRMKSVNITLQISQFKDFESMVGNLAIMKVITSSGFVPTCVYDLKEKDRRIRVANFSKWQNIEMQEYFEFLHHYHWIFKIFQNDCQIQKLEWNPRVEIMTDEKIEGKILVERFKMIL